MHNAILKQCYLYIGNFPKVLEWMFLIAIFTLETDAT